MVRIVHLWLILGTVVTLGCSSNHPSLGKVRGTVSYRGKPIAAGSLIFDVSGARPARATIINGEIAEAGTYGVDDGVPIGQARMAVFATQTTATSRSLAGKKKPTTPQEALAGGINVDAVQSLIPQKYSHPATSGLAHSIQAGDNFLTIDLQ